MRSPQESLVLEGLFQVYKSTIFFFTLIKAESHVLYSSS